jgi:hypothetical protein
MRRLLPLIALLCLVSCGRHRRRVVVHEVTVVQSAPAPGSEVVVEAEPPPPQAETRPPAPSTAHVWVTGYWSWRDGWAWTPGVWVLRPRPAAAWVPGHWARRPRGWVWIPGHWS